MGQRAPKRDLWRASSVDPSPDRDLRHTEIRTLRLTPEGGNMLRWT